MAERKDVRHEGVVTGISAQTLEVTIESHSACSACHAKGACGMADMKKKVITARKTEGDFKIGDRVTVYASLNHAIYSVIIAYIMPSVLILAGIFFLEQSGINELTAAIGSLILLILYFIILFLFRNKIGKKINFTVQKNDNY